MCMQSLDVWPLGCGGWHWAGGTPGRLFDILIIGLSAALKMRAIEFSAVQTLVVLG